MLGDIARQLLMLARVDHIDTGSQNGYCVGARLCGDAQGASVRRAVNTQSHARDNGQAAFGGGGGEAVGIAQALCAGVSAADDRERWGAVSRPRQPSPNSSVGGSLMSMSCGG